jgi:hypothetical protein
MTINVPIYIYRWIYLILLACMFSIVFVPRSSGADSDPERESVTINVMDEPLNQVLGKISKASGYEIVFDEKWGNMPVSLSFENEPLDKALNRVLANLNHAVIWNEVERKISIFISGETGSGRSRSSYSSGASGKDYSGTGTKSDRSGSRSYERMPSYKSQTEPYDRSEGIKRLPESEPLQQDPAVSLTGRETHFEQNSSTID